MTDHPCRIARLAAGLPMRRRDCCALPPSVVLAGLSAPRTPKPDAPANDRAGAAQPAPRPQTP